jgi:hypothetical protein
MKKNVKIQDNQKFFQVFMIIFHKLVMNKVESLKIRIRINLLRKMQGSFIR